MCAKGQEARYSRMEHALVRAYGSRWSKRHLAMFTAYIDDSGTDPKQAVAIAALLIVPGTALRRMEKRWGELKEKEGFDCFHTSECIHRNPKKVFANWSQTKQKRVLESIREITKGCSDRAFSFAVNKSDYDEVVPEEIKTFGKFHYSWAIRHVIEHAEQWARRQKLGAPLEYVFDFMDNRSQKEAKAEVEAILAQAECLNPGRFAGHYSFRKRCEVPALQCTDLLAWSYYQFALQVFHKRKMHKSAKACVFDFERHRNGLWILATAIKREELQKWGSRELDSPLSQKRRQQWKDTGTISASLRRT